ncbi:LIC10906 family membrane protein [Leptospira santarosai]|uniref:LIC10906 family membrane protein n=1 Tax=Leptospira santarosai TaxID=28183 RepID=UPI000298675D|nr:histidine kinase N-terminal 7TM domain-containing protein [Leptospira santarosai]EKR92376.1 putative membrane protein [Leptospira santarosai str. CBC379]MDI7182992.1 histidine kinase N-terminal 7TM domain-containing protein [Leptospira santarosai]MDI7182995.1 histidine kinase N-terminal 7TM domain-containing protein [Leptospira santarosai]
MFAGSLLTITISLFILYFGIYVYRIDLKKRIQTYFLLLSVALSLWMGGLGLRSFFPLTYREIFLNWILFPVVYIPFFLDLVVCSLMRKKFKFNFYRVVSVFVILPTFSLISLLGAFVKLNDPIHYTYSPYINYHLFIFYIIVSVAHSTFSLGRVMVRRSGDERIRSFLMLTGLVIALSVSIIFVYILPLMGLFKAYYSALGLLPFAIFGAVAILHYDAFKIRELVMNGSSLPLLNRVFSIVVLSLYRLMDRNGYKIKLILSKANVTLNIVDKHYELAARYPFLEKMERAEIVANIYRKRIR